MSLSSADAASFKEAIKIETEVCHNLKAPPKRIRSPGLSVHTAAQSLALKTNSVILLFRVAYKDMSLNMLCRMGHLAACGWRPFWEGGGYFRRVAAVFGGSL